ncbi:MAG: hypothetical protein J6I73_02315 [Treponema sp.]|nr:hypothetical protein [Treponema sp.]
MNFDNIKTKIENFFKQLKEKICDFFAHISDVFAHLNDVFLGTREQDCTENKNESEKDSATGDSGSNENINTSEKQTETETKETTGNSVRLRQKIKSYIPLVADFIASLFYIAVVVLVVKPSLLGSWPTSNFGNILDRFVDWIGTKISIHHLPVIIKIFICYILLKLLMILFSNISFKKVVPVLLTALQLLCFSLLLIKFDKDKIWTVENLLLFIPFALLVYITFQQTMGCNGEIIKKKLKLLFVF